MRAGASARPEQSKGPTGGGVGVVVVVVQRRSRAHSS